MYTAHTRDCVTYIRPARDEQDYGRILSELLQPAPRHPPDGAGGAHRVGPVRGLRELEAGGDLLPSPGAVYPDLLPPGGLGMGAPGAVTYMGSSQIANQPERLKGGCVPPES